MNNKKTFSTRIDAERLKSLKHLAVDEEKYIGVLLEEAIDALIKKYEKLKGGHKTTGVEAFAHHL